MVSDDGIPYVLEVPHTAFVPTLDYRPLAPQYLKKVECIQDLVDYDGTFSTGFHVDETFSTLKYNGGNYQTYAICESSSYVHQPRNWLLPGILYRN